MGQGVAKPIDEQGAIDGNKAGLQKGTLDSSDAMDIEAIEPHGDDEGHGKKQESATERDSRDNGAAQTSPSSQHPEERAIPKIIVTTPTHNSDSDLDSLSPYHTPSPPSEKTSFRPFMTRAQKEALKLEQSDQMPRTGKKSESEEDVNEMTNAPPPYASTRSHTRGTQKQHATLARDTKGSRNTRKNAPRIDEAHGEMDMNEQNIDSAAATSGNTTNTPVTTADSQPISLIDFITHELWPRYCNLSPPMNSTSETTSTFATTQVDSRGVRTPTHPAPEPWVQEVHQRLVVLLGAARFDRRRAILRAMANHRTMHTLLAEEVVWVVNRGPLKGRKRGQLGVLLELFGIACKGDFWKG